MGWYKIDGLLDDKGISEKERCMGKKKKRKEITPTSLLKNRREQNFLLLSFQTHIFETTDVGLFFFLEIIKEQLGRKPMQ